MTETPTKRPARTPAQRRADLRARAVTLLMDDEASLLQSADSLVIEALLHAFRRKLPHDFDTLAAELRRRIDQRRESVTVTKAMDIDAEDQAEAVTVTTPEPTPETTPAPVTVTRGYPIEIQRLAVGMADDGKSSRQIHDEIMGRLGRAPSVSNVAKLVKSWRASIEAGR